MTPVTVALDAEEQKCARLIAGWYKAGRHEVTGQELLEAMELPPERYLQLMRRMERCGVVQNVDIHGRFFEPTPASVDVLSMIERKEAEAKEPPDIVEQLEARARRHPWAAVLIILALLLAFLVSLVNGVLDLVDRFLPKSP